MSPRPVSNDPRLSRFTFLKYLCVSSEAFRKDGLSQKSDFWDKTFDTLRQ